MNLEKTSYRPEYQFPDGVVKLEDHDFFLINVSVRIKESDRYTMEDIADEKL